MGYYKFLIALLVHTKTSQNFHFYVMLFMSVSYSHFCGWRHTIKYCNKLNYNTLKYCKTHTEGVERREEHDSDVYIISKLTVIQ